MRREFFALFAAAALLLGMSACTAVDNPSSGGGNPQEEPVVAPAQLKQGIWTEYDEALLTSGKYTEEELATMPAVAMWIQGDKGYFFTYTAEGADDLVEGKISYNNKKGKGTITFPTIKDCPLSGQSVSFTATTDEAVEFELAYEGQKVNASFAWLCENLDNWNKEIDDEDWKALMAYYEGLDADWGPDPTIDWGDLNEPLVWEEDATKVRTRVDPGTVVECVLGGVGLIASIFMPDPAEEANAKLDVVLGKIDEVLANQQKMMAKLDEINDRINAIATKLNQQETVTRINTRNEKYYNPLNTNDYYFKEAYKIYTANKSDLSKVSTDLAEYAKEWVGANEQNINLTWEYMQYITTVQHTKYGTGMDKIYDGMTYEKYPWEHLGTGDRTSYRGYDMLMITKSLFMISLYSTYCGLSNTKKGMLYDNYIKYKPKLLEFCTFKVANPNKFIVCQIPGAHFVMHKQLQKYNFYHGDKYGDCPDPEYFGRDAAYNPKWHQAGNVKIENPKELKSKLITRDEADAIFKYYAPNNENIWWTNMIVEGKTAGGAVYAQNPQFKEPCLILHDPQNRNNDNGVNRGGASFHEVWIGPVMRRPNINWATRIGRVYDWGGRSKWDGYDDVDWYMAIVEKRFDK